MRIIFAICSEGVSVDRYTNKLSIFSVIDNVASLSFPFWMPRICVAIAAQKEEDDAPAVPAKLLILLNESLIGESDAVIPFQKDGTARVVLNFNLAVPSPGKLRLVLEASTGRIDLTQISVSHITPAEFPQIEMAGVHTLADAPSQE